MHVRVPLGFASFKTRFKGSIHSLDFKGKNNGAHRGDSHGPSQWTAEEIPVGPRNGLETGLSGNFLALMPDLFRWIKMVSDYQGSEHTLGESKQNLPQ